MISVETATDEKATPEEIDAIARLAVDPDGQRLFAFLSRRLQSLDVKTRKMFGDLRTHADGRRTEIADLLNLAKSVSGGELPGGQGQKQAVKNARPPRPLDDPGWR